MSQSGIDMLPYEAQKYITEIAEGELIGSVATIHLIEVPKDGGKISKLLSINYDFSNLEDIKRFNKDIEILKTDELEALGKFGIVQPKFSRENNHLGILITGINVEYGNQYDQHLQLHGYWEWLTSVWVNSSDRIGLMWTNGLNSNETSHRAWRTLYLNGQTSNLQKIPYNNMNFFNKGVLWKHGTQSRTSGAVLAQIHHNSLPGHWIGVQFEYINSEELFPDNSWAANITNMVFTYLGWPKPTVKHYNTFVQARLQW